MQRKNRQPNMQSPKPLVTRDTDDTDDDLPTGNSSDSNSNSSGSSDDRDDDDDAATAALNKWETSKSHWYQEIEVRLRCTNIAHTSHPQSIAQ